MHVSKVTSDDVVAILNFFYPSRRAQAGIRCQVVNFNREAPGIQGRREGIRGTSRATAREGNRHIACIQARLFNQPTNQVIKETKVWQMNLFYAGDKNW